METTTLAPTALPFPASSLVPATAETGHLPTPNPAASEKLTEASCGRVVHEVAGGVPLKTWTRGVRVEQAALDQLSRVAKLPFIHKWVAAMPDVHVGLGATIGSVIATKGAVIPAAVGVDIGCGMMAVETSLTASQLPDGLRPLRDAIENFVPVGRASHRDPPPAMDAAWAALAPRWEAIVDKHPTVRRKQIANQLGTLGGGNHFIELCLDERDHVWVMLHSGSRGLGNRVGQYFIELAKKDAQTWMLQLPDQDLAYFPEGTAHFTDYVDAVSFAQDYALQNRALMMESVVAGLRASQRLPPFTLGEQAVNCHHNYVAREHHFGADVLVTRKGAVRARETDLGIIPGSMGTQSFIVRGKGQPESFCSCSHGAGRQMSRTAARKVFSTKDHVAATAGVECRKDAGVIDETPGAYKPIEAVMAAQADLVDIVHTLRQVVCVKG
jgi:tRNA-splicing ligase RtcB (3'-phosphate/5'-hydroxy nucleic acid ligase)